jgi:gluconate kinase
MAPTADDIDRRPLIEALAMATSKTQDNPHHHKIVCTALEEYEQSTTPQKGEFLLMAAAYLAAARSMRDCYELYGKYVLG